MLKKLLKYDLKSGNKVLVIFYALAILFATLTRLFSLFDDSLIFMVIGKICGGVTISMIFNILINNVMRLWSRFRSNFYGDESYLTHTLPVKRSTHYLSKTLTALITLIVSTFVSALSLFIAYYSKGAMEMIKAIILPIADMLEINVLGFIILIVFVLFLEIFNILQCGYIGMVLGHRCNSGKIGFSVLLGLAVYSVSQMFVLLVIFIVALFNSNVMDLFLSSQLNSLDTIKFIGVLAIVIYIVLAVIGYLVGDRLFKKGVNVD